MTAIRCGNATLDEETRNHLVSECKRRCGEVFIARYCMRITGDFYKVFYGDSEDYVYKSILIRGPNPQRGLFEGG